MAGYRCPKCNSLHTKVTSTYGISSKNRSKTQKFTRRRTCQHCHWGFKTVEILEEEILPKEEKPPIEPVNKPPELPPNPFLKP